jgi:hypothetical protein
MQLESSPDLINWLENHSALATTIVGWALSLAAFLYTMKFSAKQTRDDLTDLTSRFEDLDKNFNAHEKDFRRHIDPERDLARHQDLLGRLKRIEDKLDRHR